MMAWRKSNGGSGKFKPVFEGKARAPLNSAGVLPDNLLQLNNFQ